MKVNNTDPGSKELLSALNNLDRLIAISDWVAIYREAVPLEVEAFHTSIDWNLKLHLKK